MPPRPSTSAVVEAIELRSGASDGRLLVVIDGYSGAGKSTLAAAVASALRATIVDGDDFYAGGTAAQWDSRSAAANADRCIDWRRLRREALEPLLDGRQACWRPYDWDRGGGLRPASQPTGPATVIILDGAYSSRPELADLVGLTVLVDSPAAKRLGRVARRDAPFDERWFARWDAAERHYFTHVRPVDSFDLVVSGAGAAASQ